MGIGTDAAGHAGRGYGLLEKEVGLIELRFQPGRFEWDHVRTPAEPISIRISLMGATASLVPPFLRK
jgi:hypothetical protein